MVRIRETFLFCVGERLSIGVRHDQHGDAGFNGHSETFDQRGVLAWYFVAAHVNLHQFISGREVGGDFDVRFKQGLHGPAVRAPVGAEDEQHAPARRPGPGQRFDHLGLANRRFIVRARRFDCLGTCGGRQNQAGKQGEQERFHCPAIIRVRSRRKRSRLGASRISTGL